MATPRYMSPTPREDAPEGVLPGGTREVSLSRALAAKERMEVARKALREAEADYEGELQAMRDALVFLTGCGGGT